MLQVILLNLQKNGTYKAENIESSIMANIPDVLQTEVF